MSAPAKRPDDAHLRLKTAMERRLFKKDLPHFKSKKKRAYPSQKTPPKGY